MTWAAVVALVVGVSMLGRTPLRAARRRPRTRPAVGAAPPLARPTAWWASAGLLGLTMVVWVPPGPWLLAAAAIVPLVGLVGPRALAHVADRRGDPGTSGADVALAADLVVAGLAAGVPLMIAVRAAGEAIGGPIGAVLAEASHRHGVGADPTATLAGLTGAPATARLGRALLRASESGMSPVHVLQAAADGERGRRRTDRVSRARAAGSLAALPVGVFFLPAFVLVAVVPVVVGALSTVVPSP
jgi:Flp pilus assembly protein TadB